MSQATRCLVGATLVAASSALLTAQSSRPTTRPTGLDHRAAVERWLAAKPPEGALDQAVAAVLDRGDAALQDVATQVRSRLRDADPPRERIELLLRDLAVGFMERARASGMFFAGQDEPLAPLQPYVGRIYLQLVTRTPDWFPLALRPTLVTALRDLYPDGPDEHARDALRLMAMDEELEKPDVRFALACAFAQWGDRELVQPRLDELESSAGERETADELHFSRELAWLHYELRDYDRAYSEWRRYLRGREALEDPPLPLDYYNAACSASLAGDVTSALDELERCAVWLRSDATDDSHLIDRRLFDEDPELRAVRSTRRFRSLVEATFERDSR